MAYKGKFTPIHPEKYKGNVSNIVYRSLWERNCMKTFDTSPNILAWASEELFIPYISPVDGRPHRYFPDFLVKVQTKKGIVKYLIEVKPAKQVDPPALPKSGKKTRKFYGALSKWMVNDAKWAAARQWCVANGYEFKIMTEHICT